MPFFNIPSLLLFALLLCCLYIRQSIKHFLLVLSRSVLFCSVLFYSIRCRSYLLLYLLLLSLSGDTAVSLVALVPGVAIFLAGCPPFRLTTFLLIANLLLTLSLLYPYSLLTHALTYFLSYILSFIHSFIHSFFLPSAYLF